MTDQQIARLMAGLQEEDTMAKRDGERRFDGSPTWKSLTQRMANEVLGEAPALGQPDVPAEDDNPAVR